MNLVAGKHRRSDGAMRKIVAKIHDGTFGPEQRLPAERDLAELLAISRATLRDALNRLEASGYIVRRAGSGNYVSSSIPEEARTPLEAGIRERLITLQEIIDVRKPLEVWAAAQAAGQRTGAQLRELAVQLKIMQRCGALQDVASLNQYARADIEFHLIIARMTGNLVYLNTLQFLTDLISQSLEISREALSKDFSGKNTRCHEAILAAIKESNSVTAGKAMKAHFTHVENRIRSG